MAALKFCPACGENVETYVIDRMGKKEEVCIHCAMIVEGAHALEVPAIGRIIIADDSPLIRELLKDTFQTSNMTEDIVQCKDGGDFITSYTNNLKDKHPVSLVILDVSMPILNGVNAAIAMRSIEKGFQTPPTPILFFTAQKCDENFQKVLNYCKPCQYVNKGVSSSPDQLASRVMQVVKMLLHIS